MPRQASSTTETVRPKWRASQAVQPTQKSVATPQTTTSVMPRDGEPAVEPGAGLAVGFQEGGVAVDASIVAFAQDETGMGDVEVRMEASAGRAHDAVIGPEDLRAVEGVDGFVDLPSRMAGGEGGMAWAMPVLRQHDIGEPAGEPVDGIDDLVTARHGKGAAGHEVVLHIDDKQGSVCTHPFFLLW